LLSPAVDAADDNAGDGAFLFLTAVAATTNCGDFEAVFPMAQQEVTLFQLPAGGSTSAVVVKGVCVMSCLFLYVCSKMRKAHASVCRRAPAFAGAKNR